MSSISNSIILHLMYRRRNIAGNGRINIPPHKKQQYMMKLSWYVKAPVRVLCRIRQFYVSSLIQCTDGSKYGDVVSGHTAMALPRSYSRNSSQEDYRELARAVSQRELRRSLNLNERGTVAQPRYLPRSQTTVIERIDEDKPMEFHGDLRLGNLYVPRSRSVVPTRNQRTMS